MLQLIIPGARLFDERTNRFIDVKEHSLQLEHSLMSLSKWESITCKPYLTKEPKTPNEIREYVKCMTITQNVNPDVYYGLTNELIDKVVEYIEAPMTATWFNEVAPQKPSRQIITSELIYYWMIAYNIPFECQKWHLNRLLTLIKVCEIKNRQANSKKKRSKAEILSNNYAMNMARRAKTGSKG